MSFLCRTLSQRARDSDLDRKVDQVFVVLSSVDSVLHPVSTKIIIKKRFKVTMRICWVDLDYFADYLDAHFYILDTYVDWFGGSRSFTNDDEVFLNLHLRIDESLSTISSIDTSFWLVSPTAPIIFKFLSISSREIEQFF